MECFDLSYLTTTKNSEETKRKSSSPRLNDSKDDTQAAVTESYAQLFEEASPQNCTFEVVEDDMRLEFTNFRGQQCVATFKGTQETIYKLPLSKEVMTEFLQMYDYPFFKLKLIDMKREFGPDGLLGILNAYLFTSQFKKGTLEYYKDQVFGTRRRRDEFYSFLCKQQMMTEQGDDRLVDVCSPAGVEYRADDRPEDITTDMPRPERFCEEFYERMRLKLIVAEMMTAWPSRYANRFKAWFARRNNKRDGRRYEANFDFWLEVKTEDCVHHCTNWDNGLKKAIMQDLLLKKTTNVLKKDRLKERRQERQKKMTVNEGAEQGDDGTTTESLESASQISSTKNMTFVDERPVDTATLHTKSEVMSGDTKNDISESKWNMNDVLTREYPLKSFDWGVSDTREKKIVDEGLPKMITDDKDCMITRQLQFFAFLRSGIKVRIQLNGTKFHCGRLIAYFKPLTWADDTEENFYSLTCFPHAFLDASVSNSAILEIPFTHLLTHFSQQKGTVWSESINSLGSFVIRPYNVLQAAEKSSQSLHGQVYISLLAPEVHLPTHPIDDFSYGTGYMQGLEGVLKKTAGSLIGGGLGLADKFTGGLVTGAGDAICNLLGVCDKPTDPVAPAALLNRTVAPLSHGAGLDKSTRLALCPTSQTETTPDILGAFDGDNDLRNLCKIPCLLDTFEWNSSRQPGDRVFDMIASPVYLSSAQTVSKENKAASSYSPTMLAYVSRAFCYWRGNLKLKIQVVATQFHSGRLALVFDPHGVGGFNLTDYRQNRSHNIIVMDIQEQQELTIELPYFAVRPWLRCDKFRGNTNLNDTMQYTNRTCVDCDAMGAFRIYVMNSLVKPDNVADKIDVNVFIMAGDNFELSVPNPVAPLSVRVDNDTTFGQLPLYPWCEQTVPPKFPLENQICQYEMLIRDLYDAGKKMASKGEIQSGTTWYDVKRMIETDDTETFSYACYKIQLLYKTGKFSDKCKKLIDTLPKFTTSPLSQAIERVEVVTTGNATKLDQVLPDLDQVKRDAADAVQNSRTAYTDLKEILTNLNRMQADLTKTTGTTGMIDAELKDLIMKVSSEGSQLREAVKSMETGTTTLMNANTTKLDRSIITAKEVVKNALDNYADETDEKLRNISATLISVDDNARNARTNASRSADLAQMAEEAALETTKEIGKVKKDTAQIKSETAEIKKDTTAIKDWTWNQKRLAEEQGVESYTTTRDDNGPSVAINDGQTRSDVAKTTTSENAMNLQTVMRRFYPLWISPTITNSNKFTLITVPVSPSFVLDAKEHQLSAGGTQNFNTHNLAWFTRLFTYNRGSLRYKLLFTADKSDVYVWHNPVDAKKFAVTSGLDYATITDQANYATEAAVSQVQQGIEVEVPFYSGFNQLLHSHISEKQDLRAQNGTLYIAVRNTGQPFSLSLFISTGDDFIMNVLRMAPVVHEGWAERFSSGEHRDTVFPEMQKEMTHRSNHVQVPGTGIYEAFPGVYTICPDTPKPNAQDFRSNQLLDEKQQMEEQMFSPTETLAGIAKKCTGADKFEAIYETEVRPKLENANDLVTEMRTMIDDLQTQTIPGILGHARVFHRDVKDTHEMISDFLPKLEEAFEHFNACMIKYNQVGDTFKLAGEAVGVAAGTAGFMMETMIVSGIWLNIVEIMKKFKWVNVLNLICLTCSLFRISPGAIVSWIIQQVNSLYEVYRTKSNDGTMAEGTEQGLEEFLQEYSEQTSMAFAAFATVVYCALFGKLPSWKYIKKCIQETVEHSEQGAAEFMRNIHFSNMGFKAIGQTYEFFQKWIKKLVDWLLGNENKNVLMKREFEERGEQVAEWIDNIAKYEDEDLCHLALVDIEAHNKLYKLMDQGKEFLRWVIREDVSKVVSSVIRDAQRRLNDVVKRMNEIRPGHGFRYAPFVVMLDGPSSIAKTNVMYKFSDMFREELDIPYYNSTYAVPTTAKYLDGYQGQTIIEWDDMMQCPEQDVMVAEFINWRSNADFIVNKAALNEKGMHFVSKAITITTNNGDVKLNTVRSIEAFRNRINIKFKCKLAAGWNVGRIKALEKKDQEYSFLRFDAYEVGRTGEIFHLKRDNMTYAQAMEYARTAFKAWDVKQKDLVSEYMADHGDMRMPKGIILTPEEFEDAEEDAPVAEVANPDQLEQELDEAVAEVEAREQGDDGEEEPQPSTSAGVREASEQPCKMDVEASVDPNATLTEEEQIDAELYAEDFNRKPKSYRQRLYGVYLRSKDTTKAKSSRYWDLLKKKLALWTKSWKDSVAEFYKNHPRVMQTLGIVGTLLTVGFMVKSIVGMFKPVMEEAYEPTAKGVKPRLVKAEAYEPTAKAAKPKLVRAEGAEEVNEEGCADPQTIQFARNNVQPAIYPIGWESGYRMLGMFIGGKVLLAPHHFFRRAKTGDVFWIRRGEYEIKVEFSEDRMERIRDKDACVYHIGAAINSKKNLIPFFINESDLGRIGKTTSALLTSTTAEGVVVERPTEATSNQFLVYKGKDEGAPVYTQNGWFYPVDTVSGECGSALMLCSPKLQSPRRISGMHTAGYSDRRGGFAVVLTQEMIIEATTALEARCGPQIKPAALPEDVNTTPEGYEQVKIWPEGDFSILGTMDPKMCPSQPQKTSFQKTPYHGELYPVTRKPAHLHPVDGVSPLKNSLDKYGHLTVPFPRKHINIVVADMTNELAHFKSNMFAEPVSEKVAIFGDPMIKFADPMNMSSSPGWPYQCRKQYTGYGKYYLFDFEKQEIVDEELKEKLREREEKAKRGERVPSVWRDCMKDELRPSEKVDEMKTRLFTIAPVDYTILVRKYFMPFVQMFYSHYSKFYSAVGINAESFDWTVAYNRLREFGDNTVAGDFSKFDGTLMAELIEACGEVIDNWFKIQGETNAEASLVRRVLFDEMVHTVQLVNNCVYQTHRGNPSGNPMTVIVNTMVNAMYMRLSWLEIMKQKKPHKATMHDYHENVREEIYGDDNRLVIKQDVVDDFNQLTITEALAQHGITYTTEEKGTATKPFRPLWETSFLKRKYRIDPEVGKDVVLPVMEKTTLTGLTNWVRKSDDTEEQLRSNQKAILDFAFFHGKDEYDEMNDKIMCVMRKHGIKPMCITYQEQLDRFLSLLHDESGEKFMDVGY